MRWCVVNSTTEGTSRSRSSSASRIPLPVMVTCGRYMHAACTAGPEGRHACGEPSITPTEHNHTCGELDDGHRVAKCETSPLPDGNTTFSSIHSLDTKKMSERSPFCAFHNHKLVYSLHAPQCRSPLWCSVVTGHTCGDRILRLYVWRTERALPGATPGAALPRTRGNARGGGPWAPRPTPMPHVRASAQHPPAHTHCARETRGAHIPPAVQCREDPDQALS